MGMLMWLTIIPDQSKERMKESCMRVLCRGNNYFAVVHWLHNSRFCLSVGHPAPALLYSAQGKVMVSLQYLFNGAVRQKMFILFLLERNV
jgi:hypothetical protein